MGIVAVTGDVTTTTAIALASGWPVDDDTILVEADPTGRVQEAADVSFPECLVVTKGRELHAGAQPLALGPKCIRVGDTGASEHPCAVERISPNGTPAQHAVESSK